MRGVVRRVRRVRRVRMHARSAQAARRQCYRWVGFVEPQPTEFLNSSLTSPWTDSGSGLLPAGALRRGRCEVTGIGLATLFPDANVAKYYLSQETCRPRHGMRRASPSAAATLRLPRGCCPPLHQLSVCLLLLTSDVRYSRLPPQQPTPQPAPGLASRLCVAKAWIFVLMAAV